MRPGWLWCPTRCLVVLTIAGCQARLATVYWAGVPFSQKGMTLCPLPGTVELMDLDQRLVRYTIAVADELHFGRAAARLMISEQTLSYQIKHFEATLGVALFERDHRHVALTPAGQLLVESGRRLLAETEDLVRAIAGDSRPLRVDIRTEWLGTPSRLVEHLRTHPPGARLEIRQGHGLAASLRRLLSGELDLAIARAWSEAGRLDAGFGHLLVRLEPVGVMLPSDHALAGRPEVHMAELAEVPLFILSPAEAPEWQNWQEQLVAEFGLQRGALVHGHGAIAIRGSVLTSRHAHACPIDIQPLDGVALQPLVDPVPIYPWSVVWRADRRDPGLEQVLGLIEEFVADKQWLLPPQRPWWIPEFDREGCGSPALSPRKLL
jgi:DNA-binding transcriptional LysR family regulator